LFWVAQKLERFDENAINAISSLTGLAGRTVTCFRQCPGGKTDASYFAINRQRGLVGRHGLHPTGPCEASRVLQSLVQAVVMVTHNVFQGLGQSVGTPFHVFHPDLQRAGPGGDRIIAVQEQFAGENDRRRQSQQG
jgi:hypothetical protein